MAGPGLRSGAAPRYPAAVNPYQDMPRDDLARELQDAAARLAERRQASPQERAEFAEQLRLLLIAAGNRLAVPVHEPGQPAFELARAAVPDPVGVYTEWIRRQALSARYWAIRELAETVMAPHAVTQWLEGHPNALADDGACAAALGELAALKKLPRDRRPRR